MRGLQALLRTHLLLALRRRRTLLINWLFPVVVLAVMARVFKPGYGNGIAYFLSAAITLGILFDGLWVAARGAIRDRNTGALRRYRTAPVRAISVVLAALAGGCLLYLPAPILAVALAHFAYGMALPARWLPLAALIALGVFTFRALGLLIATLITRLWTATASMALFAFSLLTLSGAALPLPLLPRPLQALAPFLPTTYLINGFHGVFFRDRPVSEDWRMVAAFAACLLLSAYLAARFFRWERAQVLHPASRAFLALALLPFAVLGLYQAQSQYVLRDAKVFWRDMQRSGNLLIRGARLFTGDGRVIEHGTVLIQGGKIAGVFSGLGPDAASLGAEVVEAAGKTLLPGLIDVHAHLASSGALSAGTDAFDPQTAMPHALAAYLYSGVTAVKSVGDPLQESLDLRERIRAGRFMGAQLFVCGPMFTTEGSHNTDYFESLPPGAKELLRRELTIVPRTPNEARQQVRDLKRMGVDGIKTVLEAGWGEKMLVDRVDILMSRVVADEARKLNLPVVIHTGDARDVTDAVELGAAGVEHGALRDLIPDALFEQMRSKQVAYSPTLTVLETYSNLRAGRYDALANDFVQQVVRPELLQESRALLASGAWRPRTSGADFTHELEVARKNLAYAQAAGITLVVGTDSGNPLVFPGAAMHHEMQLMAKSGVPSWAVLQAATFNAAKLLRAENRIGRIAVGLDADLLLVDGNPIVDISATQRISLVVFKGERVDRAALFQQ